MLTHMTSSYSHLSMLASYKELYFLAKEQGYRWKAIKRAINMICMNQQASRGVINMRRHVICLISESEIKMFFSGDNRRPIIMTNHLSNLLNQHTWMAQSKQSLFANCTGCKCVFASEREREGKEKREREWFSQSGPEGDSVAHMYSYIPTGSSKTD